MSLSQNDQERISTFYRQSIADFGLDDARSVHWASRYNQQKRFQILSAVADLNGHSVLDVGCGLGDLYTFFLENNIDVKYSGIDIMTEFINRARERFPEARFTLESIEDLKKSYDYILASGVLSFKIENHIAHYYALIKKMYTHASKALAFNMLDAKRHVDNSVFATYRPQEIKKFCKTFCSNIKIIEDYLDDDFTVYLYK
ncbi:class I SAM-dependent methyltransferase [Candidatus Parcubacteria bacterium]|nr:class I SAM-dependent methyltransferase [Candidatus Parcubacteria bacterium]